MFDVRGLQIVPRDEFDQPVESDPKDRLRGCARIVGWDAALASYRPFLPYSELGDLLTETPQEPTAFVKLNSCLVGHEAKVVKPDGITRLDYEPELVFVIGKRALGELRQHGGREKPERRPAAIAEVMAPLGA